MLISRAPEHGRHPPHDVTADEGQLNDLLHYMPSHICIRWHSTRRRNLALAVAHRPREENSAAVGTPGRHRPTRGRGSPQDVPKARSLAPWVAQMRHALWIARIPDRKNASLCSVGRLQAPRCLVLSSSHTSCNPARASAPLYWAGRSRDLSPRGRPRARAANDAVPAVQVHHWTARLT